MIKIKNVSKQYKNGNKVIDKLNLEIQDGEILGFLGPNGAGKTTTIKMITGVLKIDEGEILIDGKNIEKEPVEVKRNFGFVSDNPEIFLKLKGIEYLNFISDMYEIEKNTRIEKIKKYSEIFKMQDSLNEKIENYSHGMKQKIFIIGMLIHEAKNWILDEPMTGLDPESIYNLKELMKEHAQKGNCVFFSTHILDIAEKICDRVAIINKGKILCIGTVEELKNELKQNNSLEKLFMEITKNDK